MVESTHDVDAMASAMVALLAQMDDAASAPPPTVEEEDELPSSMSGLDGEDEDEDEALPTTSKWIPCDPPRPPPPPPPSSGLQRPIRLPQLEVAGAVKKKHPSIRGGSQVDGIDGGGLSPSAIGKVLLSPVEVMAEAVDTVVEELPLPGLRTLADLCDAASGAKYARLRLQSTCRRVGLLKRLADKHIETVPESPCASRFSSFTSSTSSSLGTSSNTTIKSFVRSLSLKSSTGGGGGGSLGAVREAARDAVGCSTWEAAFTGKALARSP